MSVRIAVSDPLPLFRSGILATLGHGGFEDELPDDLLSWADDVQHRVVFLTLQSAEDWKLLADIVAARADLLVVAVLTEASTAMYVRAILAGAAAVMPRDAAPDETRRVFQAAVAGESLLPLEVIRALASVGEPDQSHREPPSGRELEWLRELAAGATVVQLAERVGYSERAMFRLLSDLYKRMNVRNRTEALIRAQEHGWLRG
jgi:DNA-binding NarL/FixJ family response regulator